MKQPHTFEIHQAPIAKQAVRSSAGSSNKLATLTIGLQRRLGVSFFSFGAGVAGHQEEKSEISGFFLYHRCMMQHLMLVVLTVLASGLLSMAGLHFRSQTLEKRFVSVVEISREDDSYDSEIIWMLNCGHWMMVYSSLGAF